MADNHYDVLGVSKGASQDEIKKAYRKLAHQHHPDKKGGDEAKFKDINKAYQTIGNEQKRKQYDQFGSAHEQAGGAPGGANWDDFARQQAGGAGGPFGGGGGQRVEYDFGDLGDVMGDIFGFGGRRGGTRTQQQSGSDIQTEMTIQFREAVFGAEKTVELHKQVACSHCKGDGAEPGSKIDTCTTCKGRGQIERPVQTVLGTFRSAAVCPDCHGEGKKASQKCKDCHGEGRKRESEKIKVKIPAGINDGETIRLAGKGEAGARGSGVGDLYIGIRVTSDPAFVREEDNIISESSISFSQAALGDKVEIVTLDGPVFLKIPSGTQSGKVFRIKEKGVPHLRTRGRGDHLVTVRVVIPSKLNREQKKVIEQLSELD